MELVRRLSARWAGLSMEVQFCCGYHFALQVWCHLSSPLLKGEACSYFQMKDQDWRGSHSQEHPGQQDTGAEVAFVTHKISEPPSFHQQNTHLSQSL